MGEVGDHMGEVAGGRVLAGEGVYGLHRVPTCREACRRRERKGDGIMFTHVL